MNIDKIKKISVMKNSIMFLRMLYVFPNEKDMNQPNKNVSLKYTCIIIVGCYIPIGIMLHLINNIKSKY